MYCKLFASLYQGTLRGRSNEILVFTNLLAHCGKDGTVDKHFRAISEETGLTVEEVKDAITVLESPDPESRSPDENGARIVRMDEHRVWGWKVVNYGKYRAIRSEEDRAEQNRLAQERWRNKNKQSKPASAKRKRDKPKEKEEGEGNGEVKELSAHADFVKLWTDEYPKFHDGEKYVFQSGKDGAAVKALISTSEKTPLELLRIAVAAWKSPDKFNCKSAASLTGFNSKINEIRAELNKGRSNGESLRDPDTHIPSTAEAEG